MRSKGNNSNSALVTKTIYINWEKFEDPQIAFELFEVGAKKKGMLKIKEKKIR